MVHVDKLVISAFSPTPWKINSSNLKMMGLVQMIFLFNIGCFLGEPAVSLNWGVSFLHSLGWYLYTVFPLFLLNLGVLKELHLKKAAGRFKQGPSVKSWEFFWCIYTHINTIYMCIHIYMCIYNICLHMHNHVTHTVDGRNPVAPELGKTRFF